MCETDGQIFVEKSLNPEEMFVVAVSNLFLMLEKETQARKKIKRLV